MLQFIRVISRRDPRRGRRGKRSLGEIVGDHRVGEGRKKTREKSERIEREIMETNRSAKKPGMEQAVIKARPGKEGRERVAEERSRMEEENKR